MKLHIITQLHNYTCNCVITLRNLWGPCVIDNIDGLPVPPMMVGDVALIRGSTGVELAAGLGHYLRHVANVSFSWPGTGGTSVGRIVANDYWRHRTLIKIKSG